MSPTRPLWQTTFSVAERPPLTESRTTEICVIGAGIAGLTVAYTLLQAGRRVIVLELAQVGEGETGHTTAHLSNELDDRYTALEKARGVDDTRLTYQAHSAAIDRIEEIVRQEEIDCDFARVDGYLFLGDDDSEQLLDDELEAAHRAGFADVEKVGSVPGLRSGAALRFPRQARLHALRYLAGLAEAVERLGGEIFCGTRVSGVEGGRPVTITTADDLTVTADQVAVCTNSPITDMVVTHAKQAPYRTFAVAFGVPRGAIPDALYWDTLDPYHYVRLAPLPDGRDALIVGGEDHKTAHDDDAGDRFQCLEEWTRDRWPVAGPRLTAWSGQVLETNDYLAFIGRNPDGAEGVWIATGDSGMGMTHGTIAGLLLPALMAGEAHPWAALFDPKRLTLHHTEMAGLARENLDVALQYGDYVTPGEVRETDDIPLGEGRVIRRGTRKIAAYRDEQGRVHERSAVCPHLKCLVDWNTAEKSWDCPCHGSRFDRFGRVVAGPASTDLAEP